LDAGVTRGDVWAHADEMRLGLHGQVRRVWAPRGVKVRQRKQIADRWTYLALAVDGQRGTLQWTWLPTVRKDALAPVVAAWRAAGIAAVVWDSSGSHRARVVRDVGLPLIALPAYAPECNPAERVFEEIRRASEGRVYPDLDAKRAVAEAVLTTLAADPDRVRRLAGWAWIAAAAASLPLRH
jgi:DDE superfamily endonuclease